MLLPPILPSIMQVGLGGRLDATNCVRQPVVCGISSLGFDHMEVLGHTLPEIAREKAGIFKAGVPAFTVPQREDASATLRERAAAVGAPLAVVRPWEAYQGASAVRLGLAGEHQKLNAALALALAGTWEASASVAAAVGGEAAARRAAEVAAGRLPPEYVAGLEAASWPGRGQIIHEFVEPVAAAAAAAADAGQPEAAAAGSAAGQQQQQGQVQPRLSFFLDGAHTAESMETCAHWFADAIGQQPAAGAAVPVAAAAVAGDTAQQPPQQGSGGLVTQRVLLFNCMQVCAALLRCCMSQGLLAAELAGLCVAAVSHLVIAIAVQAQSLAGLSLCEHAPACTCRSATPRSCWPRWQPHWQSVRSGGAGSVLMGSKWLGWGMLCKLAMQLAQLQVACLALRLTPCCTFPYICPPQISIQHALFVPPDSTYMKLGAGGEPPNLAWQHSLRSVWNSHVGGSSNDGASLAIGGARSCSSAAAAAGRTAITLPPLPAAAGPGAAPAAAAQAAGLTTAAAGAARSAVLPSLAVTLDWLRRCVREAPSLRMQVLVTGSLYLVGDLLKHLQNDGSGGSGGKA